MAENDIAVQLSVDHIQLEIKKYLDQKSVPSVDLFPDEHDDGQDITISTVGWNLNKKELGEFYNFLTHELKLKISTTFPSRILCWILDEEPEAISKEPAEKPVMISRTEIFQILEQLQITMPGVKVEVDGELEKAKIYIELGSHEENIKNMEYILRWLHNVGIHCGALKSPVENFLHLIILERIIGTEKLFTYCTPKFLRKRALEIVRFAGIKCQDAGGYSPSRPFVLRIAPTVSTSDLKRIEEILAGNGYKSVVNEGVRIKLVTTVPFAVAENKQRGGKRNLKDKSGKFKEKIVTEAVTKNDIKLKNIFNASKQNELKPILQLIAAEGQSMLLDSLSKISLRDDPKEMIEKFIGLLKREGLVIIRRECLAPKLSDPNAFVVFDLTDKKSKVAMQGGKILVPSKEFVEKINQKTEKIKEVSLEEISQMITKLK